MNLSEQQRSHQRSVSATDACLVWKHEQHAAPLHHCTASAFWHSPSRATSSFQEQHSFGERSFTDNAAIPLSELVHPLVLPPTALQLQGTCIRLPGHTQSTLRAAASTESNIPYACQESPCTSKLLYLEREQTMTWSVKNPVPFNLQNLILSLMFPLCASSRVPVVPLGGWNNGVRHSNDVLQARTNVKNNKDRKSVV